jgi:hypothetical protein
LNIFRTPFGDKPNRSVPRRTGAFRTKDVATLFATVQPISH